MLTNTIIEKIDVAKALQIYRVARQLAYMIITVGFAKLQLNLTEIGTYELLFFIGGVLSSFWMNGLLQSLLALFNQTKQQEQADLLWQYYSVLLGVALLFGGIIYVFQPYILSILVGKTIVNYFSIYLLFWVIRTPTFLLDHLFLLQNRRDALLWYATIDIFIFPTLVLLPIALNMGLGYSFYAIALFAAIKHIYLVSNIIPFKGKWQWRKALTQQILKTAWPLIVYSFLGYLMIVLDSWLVAWKYEGDEVQFALFRYGARELPFSAPLAVAFSAAMIPKVSELGITAAAQLIRQRAVRLLHLIFPAGIAGILLSPYVFPLVFNEAFKASAYIFNIYILIITSRFIFSHTLLIGLHQHRILTIVAVIELIINIVLSFYLIEIWGVYGIAMATVIAYLSEKIIYSWYLKRYFDLPFQTYTPPIYWLYVFILLSSYFLML